MQAPIAPQSAAIPASTSDSERRVRSFASIIAAMEAPLSSAICSMAAAFSNGYGTRDSS